MSIDSEEVGLEVINSDTPGLIKSPEDKFYLYLIMPIKN